MRIRLTTNHAKAVAKIQINWQLAIENRYFFSFFYNKGMESGCNGVVVVGKRGVGAIVDCFYGGELRSLWRAL